MTRKKFLKIRNRIINRDAVSSVMRNNDGSIVVLFNQDNYSIVFEDEQEADAVWREFNCQSENLMEDYLDEDLARKTLW